MLTLKLITEETERVIRGLEKKHFMGAKEAIDKVLAVDKQRREAQQQADKTKQEIKQYSSQIGALMKQGNKEEAERIKNCVAELKQTDKALQEQMENAEKELTTLLCARRQGCCRQRGGKRGRTDGGTARGCAVSLGSLQEV